MGGGCPCDRKWIAALSGKGVAGEQTSLCVCTCVDVGLDGRAVLHGWGTYQNGWTAESAWLSHCCNQACPPSVQRKRNSWALKHWTLRWHTVGSGVLLGFKMESTVLQDWVLVLARILLALCYCYLFCLFVLSTWQNLGYSRKKKSAQRKKKKPASKGWPCRHVHQVFSCLICSSCGRGQSIVNSAASGTENRLSKPVAAASLMASASVPAWACPDGLHSARGHKPLLPHIVFGPGVYHSQEKTS